MNPGRELDALVAERVMGLEPWPEQDPRWGVKAFKAKFVPYGQEPKPCEAPSYSTDIAAAWEVVEKFQACARFERVFENGKQTGWWCELAGNGDDFQSSSAVAETLPLSICLAALKATNNL